MGTPSAFPEPYREPDPAQVQQGRVFLNQSRHPPAGSWSDNRAIQAQKHKGVTYLALNAVQNEMARAASSLERRKRQDRTTFGAGAVSTVKALSASGGQGNDEDYAPVHDHPLAEMLHCPNPVETFGEMLGYMTMQWGLTGNAPVWFVPGKGHHRPVELYPLVESQMTFVRGASSQYPEGMWRVTPYLANIGGWAYSGNQSIATSVMLPGTEVRKLQAPHPYIKGDGYSPLTACAVQLDIMEALDQSRHSAFMQGTQLGTLIQIPPGASPETVDSVKAQFSQKFAGPHHAREVAVLSPGIGGEGGDIEVKQLGESPREMDYAQSWEQASSFVLAVYGVPPAIAGLKPSGGYAEFYAAQTQLHARVSQLATQFARFFTRTLAWPWCKKRGEYRIKIEVPEPRNKEAQQAYMLALGQMNVVSTNQLLRFGDMQPVRFGDLPPAMYSQKVQELEFPQPVAPAPGPDGAPLPSGEGADEGDPTAAPEDGEQGDETQDAVTSAALESLGVPAGDQQPGEGDETVQKAQRQKRQEGQVWTGNDGLRYTKRNGKIVLAPHPAGADGRYPSRHDASATYGNEDDRDSDDKYFGKKKRELSQAHSAADAIRAKLASTESRHKQEIASLQQQRAKVARPASVAPIAPPVNPQANHDAQAQRLLAGRDNVVLRIAGSAAGQMQHHRITDGATLKRYIDAGGVLPPSMYQEAAAKIPVATPQAQQTVADAQKWAPAQAAKHAARVAAHFGISQERAHALLLHALLATAEHAAKNGGAMPSVTIRNKKTGQSATLAPKGKAGPTANSPPQPKNAAGKGSLPPRGGVAKALSDGAQDDTGDEPIDDVRPELRELLSRLSGG